jgi:flagellar FliL protein
MATAQATKRVASSNSKAAGKGSGKGPSGIADGEFDDEVPVKKSKKKLIIIGVLVLVVLFAGYYFTIGSKKPKPGPPQEGAVVAVDPMTVNLTDGHFLKVGIGLQLIKGAKLPDGEAELDTSKAASALIDEYSNRSMASLSSNTARTDTVKQLVAKLKKDYPKVIMNAYLTSFVMQ